MNQNNEFIDETSSSNFFCIDKNNNLITPRLGFILPGITRDSVLIIANKLLNKKIINDIIINLITKEDLIDSKEAFITGTGVGITCVNSITINTKKIEYKTHPITNIIKNIYNNIRLEIDEDKFKWLYHCKK
jgi:branched-chain amino acid aminotransferase